MRFRMKQNVGKHQMRDRLGKVLVVCPGDVVDCDPQDIDAVKWKFDQLDPEPAPDPVVPAGKEFRVVAVDGGFNVVQESSGEPLNDEPLTAQDAADLAGVSLETVEAIRNETDEG